MTGETGADHGRPNGPEGIAASMHYLQHQDWWPTFRQARSGTIRLIDDVLWVGHFCGWLREHARPVEQCDEDDLSAYLASTGSFRPGPRVACEHTAKALVDFMTETRSRRNPPLVRVAASHLELAPASPVAQVAVD